MQHTAADGPRLGPQAAYSRWIDACTDAGWLGVPAAEQVPVRERLGRVTAAPVRACWPAPRGLTDSRCFTGNLDGLADTFQLYLPDRRGHGRTPDAPGPITIELMAQDTIAFLEKRSVVQPDWWATAPAAR